MKTAKIAPALNGGLKPGKRMFKEITGRHVLFMMLGFFGVIIATDAYLVYKAVSTFGGIETNDAYRKGIQYNQRISDARVQADLGWAVESKIDATTGELKVAVTDRDGKAVEGLTVRAVVGRPATNAEDRTVALTPVASGVYATALGNIGPGSWIATLTAGNSGADGMQEVQYQAKVRLWKAP